MKLDDCPRMSDRRIYKHKEYYFPNPQVLMAQYLQCVPAEDLDEVAIQPFW